MKKIKIKFSGMTGNFNENNNFITDALKQRFDVEICDSPDYLIYSVNSKDYLNYDCIRIYYTPENLVPDFNVCDYAIGFSYLDFEDRYIRYPIYLVDSFKAYDDDDYESNLNLALHKHENYTRIKKTDFCSFVYSNGKAAKCRKKLFEALSNYKKVNSGGTYLNNVGGRIDNKLEFQRKHKFVIAFENSSTSGYTTEKIIHAFASGSIPIYWGDPKIGKVFNNDSFINCHLYGLTEDGEEEAIDRIVEKVREIDRDANKYRKMLATPAFINYEDVYGKYEELEKFLINIFSQDKEKAFRRNRMYWGERYERKQKIGNAFYWQCRKLIPLRDFLKKIFKKS